MRRRILRAILAPRGQGERLALILMGSLAMWCASAPSSWASPACAMPPPELRKVLQIRTPDGSGHGFASTLLEIYTALHVVKNEPEIHYHGGDAVAGAASVTWTDEKADIAKLTAYRIIPAVLEFAGKEPDVGETLWFAGFRFDQGTGDVFYEGRYMGRDEKGLLVVDSNGVEGFSGSPLLNAAGKVVGLMLLYGHPTEVYENFKCEKDAAKDRLPCDLQFLMQVSRHRSMTFAAPLWKAR